MPGLLKPLSCEYVYTHVYIHPRGHKYVTSGTILTLYDWLILSPSKPSKSFHRTPILYLYVCRLYTKDYKLAQ